ncbi:MAG: metal ABC transporter substrate-binding protein [Planctomycetota bacterium]
MNMMSERELRSSWSGTVASRGSGVRSIGFAVVAAVGLFLSMPIMMLMGGCQSEDAEDDAATAGAEQERPVVMTTFYPTTYFVERIAGDTVEVMCPLPEGEDAKTWQPSESVIAEFQQADLIVINGADFEGWVTNASLPQDRLVDSARPMAHNFLQMEEVTHSHGPGGEHTHAGIDPHTWMDPVMAKTQARRIADALIERYGDHQELYETNFAELAADLDRLDARMQSLTPMIEEAAVFASHPAYNYPAARYGWEIHNVFVDPGAPISDDALHDIGHVFESEELALKFPRIMLFEERPLPEVQEQLESDFTIRTVIFSPAESRSSVAELGGEQMDYLTVMQENVNRFERALATQG